MGKKKGDNPKDKGDPRPLVGQCQLPGWESIASGVMGRPTDYHPNHCAVVIDLGKQGYSKAMMASHLDVVRQTLDDWAKKYPDFSNAMLRAREHSLAWWEAQGNLGIWSREFNANAYRLQVVNRFPVDWRDKQAEGTDDVAPPPTKVEIVVTDARK